VDDLEEALRRQPVVVRAKPLPLPLPTRVKIIDIGQL
jgi:hypothetical protein